MKTIVKGFAVAVLMMMMAQAVYAEVTPSASPSPKKGKKGAYHTTLAPKKAPAKKKSY